MAKFTPPRFCAPGSVMSMRLPLGSCAPPYEVAMEKMHRRKSSPQLLHIFIEYHKSRQTA